MKNLKEFPKIIKYPDPETGEKVWAVQSANFIDLTDSFYIACKLWLWNVGVPAKWLF